MDIQQPQPGGTATRRAVIAGAFAALPFAARAAAPPPPPQPFTLRFATNYAGVHPMAKVVRGLIDDFRKDYPAITVAIEETPGNDHQTKIKLDASSDRMPDVFNYWRLDPGFGLDQIARAGKVADLTEWTKSDPAFQNLFDDYSWKTATLDGKTYGVPAIMFYVEFLANRAVFAQRERWESSWICHRCGQISEPDDEISPPPCRRAAARHCVPLASCSVSLTMTLAVTCVCTAAGRLPGSSMAMRSR